MVLYVLDHSTQITCNAYPAAGSFAYFQTNPGYNIQDCALQCFGDPGNFDCLGATYTAPNQVVDPNTNTLLPGTCTFYEFVVGVVKQTSGPAVDLAQFV
jgi:hypothetical protein